MRTVEKDGKLNGSIWILPDHIVNLIAAGEVVERPASVVKELVENSLDSGATSIDIELEYGGRRAVTVRDNGDGMNRHDLLLSVQRHATSKIRSSSDMNNLNTLGFRGEALPSIAAVSHMEILSSTEGNEGWQMQIDGGVLNEVKPCRRTKGTTVSVRSLFYNQPARRKFLRSEATELTWVESFVTGFSFFHIGVDFNLVHNNRELFNLPSEDNLEKRARRRYQIGSSVKAFCFEFSDGDYSCRGLCFPEKRWNSRRQQYIIVNGRQVKAPPIQIPLDRFLSGPAGYPLIICILSLPGKDVDVNVHPAKREVRFREPFRVEKIVESALLSITSERRLHTVAAMRNNLSSPSEKSGWKKDAVNNHYTDRNIQPPPISTRAQSAVLQLNMPFDSKGYSSEQQKHYDIMQFGRLFLVSATQDALVIIDQHAAHERILFEKILAGINKNRNQSQQHLLWPESIQLDLADLEIAERYRQELGKAGFDFEINGKEMLINSIPAGFKNGSAAIRELLCKLQEPSGTELPEKERIAALAACAGAVKAGDSLSIEEARSILDQLFSTGDPFHCPHGRPTIIEISFSELEKRFGR